MKLCMCPCKHVHVRAGVYPRACAFAGVGQRTCGLCVSVRACVRVCAFGVLMCVYVCALVSACACVCACDSGFASVTACA